MKFQFYLFTFFSIFYISISHSNDTYFGNRIHLDFIPNATSYSKSWNQYSFRDVKVSLGKEIREHIVGENRVVEENIYALILSFVFPDIPHDYNYKDLVYRFTFKDINDVSTFDPWELNDLIESISKYYEWRDVAIKNNIQDYVKLIKEVDNSYNLMNQVPKINYAFTKYYVDPEPYLAFLMVTWNEPDPIYPDDLYRAEYYFNKPNIEFLKNFLNPETLAKYIINLEDQKNIDNLFN